MTQHTPGPWKVGKKGRIEGDHNDIGGCMVVVSEHSIGDYRNARLIAAAPDLLAALEQTVRALGHISWVNYADDPRTEECKRAWIAGNAAIEKAGGDSVGAPSAKAEEGS